MYHRFLPSGPHQEETVGDTTFACHRRLSTASKEAEWNGEASSKAKEEEHRRIPPKGNEEGERRNEEAVNEDINRKGVRSEAGPLSGICTECCVQL